MRKIILSIVFLLSLSSVSNGAGKSLVDKVESVESELMRLLSRKYVNFCGNENYKKAGWDTEQDCLTDGRVHLVYANKEDGSHHSSQGISFTDIDKGNLLTAIRNGAEVIVQEDNHFVRCAESAVSNIQNVMQAVCSSHDRIYAEWAQSSRSYDAEYNRFSTNGHREYVIIYVGRQGENDVVITKNSSRWLIRY